MTGPARGTCGHVNNRTLDYCGEPAEITAVVYDGGGKDGDVVEERCRKHITALIVDQMRPGGRQRDGLDATFHADIWPTWKYEAYR